MTSETDLPDAALRPVLDQLTLEEKVQLLTARTFWTTWPLPRIGLRSMLFSDGPSGVRGEHWDERDPSLGLPSATVLSSSWDREVARSYGRTAAVEAQRKGVDVVLGPTINIHRSPLGGRHFEAFSEDPFLSGELAAAYVEGVQSEGVAATPKHYVANDSETERFLVDVVVDEKTLREVYLWPFERAVAARAWSVMSSYNSINGLTATENPLLATPLKDEWAFDGVVVSDWTAVRSVVPSARAEQDLVFPGPRSPWSDGLLDAVRAGEVGTEAIDRKVLRVLRLAVRVGALNLDGSAAGARGRHDEIDSAGTSFARTAAADGTVLLANDGVVPLAADVRVALIGDSARHARTQGGGSATVLPPHEVSPLEGLRSALGDRLTYSPGCLVTQGIRPIPLSQLRRPDREAPGVVAQFLSADGTVLFEDVRLSTDLQWASGAPVEKSHRLVLRTRFVPESDGTVVLGVRTVGEVTLTVDAQSLWTESLAGEGMDLGAALKTAGERHTPLAVRRGVPVSIELDHVLPKDRGDLNGHARLGFGLVEDDSLDADRIEEAARAAAEADVAVVVVGTTNLVESEGFDRTSLRLPGRQDELVSRVLESNPRTVVVVNSGAPVLLPWRDRAAAVVLTYFGGQAMGHALADVLTGAVEPGGRLPTTWPSEEADVPVLGTQPTDGALIYSERIHVGYRAWLREHRSPAYVFGHGLGYTTWSLDALTAPDQRPAGTDFSVTVRLTNTGRRRGKQVVQVYAERERTAYDRPGLWLVGFAAVSTQPGETRDVQIAVTARALATWDDGWVHEPGEVRLRAGTSSADLPLSAEVRLDA